MRKEIEKEEKRIQEYEDRKREEDEELKMTRNKARKEKARREKELQLNTNANRGLYDDPIEEEDVHVKETTEMKSEVETTEMKREVDMIKETEMSKKNKKVIRKDTKDDEGKKNKKIATSTEKKNKYYEQKKKEKAATNAKIEGGDKRKELLRTATKSLETEKDKVMIKRRINESKEDLLPFYDDTFEVSHSSSNNLTVRMAEQNAPSLPLLSQACFSKVIGIENVFNAATNADIEIFDEDGDIVMESNISVNKHSVSLLQGNPCPKHLIDSSSNIVQNNMISTFKNSSTPYVGVVGQDQVPALHIAEIIQNNAPLMSIDLSMRVGEDLIKDKNSVKLIVMNKAGDSNCMNSIVPINIKNEFNNHNKAEKEHNCPTEMVTNGRNGLLNIDEAKDVPVVIKKEFKDITYLHTLSAIAEVNKYSSYQERGRGSDYRRRLEIADSNREEMNIRKRQQKEKQMRKDEKSLQHNLRQTKIKADAQEREKARDLYGLKRERTSIDTLDIGIPYIEDYIPIMEHRGGSLSNQELYSMPNVPLSYDSSYKYSYNPQSSITPYPSDSWLPLAPLLSIPTYSSLSSSCNQGHVNHLSDSSSTTSLSYPLPSFHLQSNLSFSSSSPNSINVPVPVPIFVNTVTNPSPASLQFNENDCNIHMNSRMIEQMQPLTKSNINNKGSVGTVEQDSRMIGTSFDGKSINNTSAIKDISWSINRGNTLTEIDINKNMKLAAVIAEVEVEVKGGTIEMQQATKWREMKRISDMKKNQSKDDDHIIKIERGHESNRNDDQDNKISREKRRCRSRSRSRSSDTDTKYSQRSDRHFDQKFDSDSRVRHAKKISHRGRSRSRSRSRSAGSSYKRSVTASRSERREDDRGRERSSCSSLDRGRSRYRVRSRSKC